MGEMYPPTAADYAIAAADSAKAETKRLREELDGMYETVRAHIPAEPNLRDMFAAQALPAVLGLSPVFSSLDSRRQWVVREAYLYADAMMAERKKNAG